MFVAIFSSKNQCWITLVKERKEQAMLLQYLETLMYGGCTLKHNMILDTQILDFL